MHGGNIYAIHQCMQSGWSNEHDDLTISMWDNHWDYMLWWKSYCVRVLLLIPHPVASEHRWLVKAPRWIHSVPDVSGRRSSRPGCHARLWNLHVTNASRLLVVNITSPRSRSIKRHQWKHKLDYYGVDFAHLATGCGINAKDTSGLDSDQWIPHSRCCENPARAKALAGFSRHLSAGFTDLNPALRGLSLYKHLWTIYEPIILT